jgi:tetratricopeptide (TPR) repeat protein
LVAKGGGVYQYNRKSGETGVAEGLLGGMLGKDDEKPEIEAPDALAGAEAFASAVAAKLAGNDPEVARDTSAFLKKQAQLLEIQAQHLKDEHALRVAHLRNQLREEKVRRVILRLRVGFQLFIALVATVIGIGAAIMIRDAVTSRRVVIEPFQAPPDVPARGINGIVIASGLLDELSRLQDATRSSSAARGLAGAWTGNIKLDVPETGISLGEISRLLRERFGHDVHIDGDLIETSAGGLALTVRGNSVPPKTFSAGSTDLDKLTVAAAEYVYSKSQPARWATYLTNMERFDEAVQFARNAMASADSAERPKLLNTWSIAILSSGGSVREALELVRAAVKLQPDHWSAHVNIQNDLMILGDEEGAWKAGEDMRRAAGGRPGPAAETYYTNWDYLTWNLRTWLDATVADAETNAGAGTGGTAAGPQIADIQARLHDPEGADLALKTTKIDPHDPTVAAMSHYVRGRLAAEAGDVATAASEMEAYGTAYADPAVSTNNPGYHCWIAPAEEAAGHPDKADAMLKSAGTYVDCYRFRGDILESRGDWAGAQKAYTQATALAPDLPAAYYSWGVALAKHGEFAAAESKLKDANQRGPHWADPLKAWGDVLAKHGKIKEAIAKYDEALKFAPKWKQLKEAREALVKQKV